MCHVTSVPSDYGVGDFGRSSREFIDFLASQKLNVWQILPLNETNEYNCPYASTCYFSYDEMFVDVEALVDAGKVDRKELSQLKKYAKTKKVKYTPVKTEKRRILEIAYANMDAKTHSKLVAFAEENPDVFNYGYYKTLLDINNTKNWRDIDKVYWSNKTKEYKAFVEANLHSIYKYVYFQYLQR